MSFHRNCRLFFFFVGVYCRSLFLMSTVALCCWLLIVLSRLSGFVCWLSVSFVLENFDCQCPALFFTPRNRMEQWGMESLYTVKKGYRFSRPQSGCHLPNSLWPGIIIYSRPGKSLVSDRKIANLFLQCRRRVEVLLGRFRMYEM